MSVAGCKFNIVIDVEAIMVVMKAFDKTLHHLDLVYKWVATVAFGLIFKLLDVFDEVWFPSSWAIQYI